MLYNGHIATREALPVLPRGSMADNPKEEREPNGRQGVGLLHSTDEAG